VPSKLASGIEGNDRAALEALVGMGDTSVPGVEMCDIGDGDILSRTREQVNSSGLFQFVYIPEDGSENITSDWVDQEHKKKLVRQWVDGVKAALIGRSQSKIQEAKDKQLEDRARQIRQEQMQDETADIPSSAVAETVQTRRELPDMPGVRRSPQVAESPEYYVNEHLDAARERLRAAESTQNDLVREILAARKEVAKWAALAAALQSSDVVQPVRDSKPFKLSLGGDDSHIQVG
jgi:hypothetical protein